MGQLLTKCFFRRRKLVDKTSYKSLKSFEARQAEVSAAKINFPLRLPLVVEKSSRESTLPTLRKIKFLVPPELTVSQFITILRSRMNIKQMESVFLLINGRTVVPMSATLSELYREFSEEDGFLYVTYISQVAFG
ncbi:unnamed protein product [Soboliphyme baturini]|uniref:Ubiquitin-like protein ATG12 n=1 Tax=Soboliphyme baturini TaxID=241478 RepID=A0A183IE89_9BILA|nr:unnamed protein product [Soboliphyme baturini]